MTADRSGHDGAGHDADCLSRGGGRYCDCQGLVRKVDTGRTPSQDVLNTITEQVQHAVRQIDNALLDTRLNDMGRLYLRKVRGTLLFTEDVGDLWPEGQWEAAGPVAPRG